MTVYGYAGFWRRALAFLVDSLILWVPEFLVERAAAREVLLIASPLLTFLQRQITELLVSSVASALIWWLYSTFFLSSAWQATPGKRMAGIRVADLAGHRITPGRASLRFLLSFVSGLTFGIGYLLAAITPKKQSLHDLIAGTLVLRVEEESDDDAA
jgi:uncharacterized RDD family membrane protein YckC